MNWEQWWTWVLLFWGVGLCERRSYRAADAKAEHFLLYMIRTAVGAWFLWIVVERTT